MAVAEAVVTTEEKESNSSSYTAVLKPHHTHILRRLLSEHQVNGKLGERLIWIESSDLFLSLKLLTNIVF